jgi:MFS family permease
VFLLLSDVLDDAQFFRFGWRIPFLASALLVILGLYMRLRLTETPAFRAALANNERVRVPMLSVAVEHPRALLLGTLAATATFVLFYLMTVFSLTWGTSALHYPRQQFLLLQMIGVVFFALTIPLSAVVADRRGRHRTLAWVSAAIAVFGLLLAPLFGSGQLGGVLLFLVLGQALMGMTYGPLGTLLAEMFPTAVRYTGASLTFNLAGILGASLAPYAATWLAVHHGLPYVGYYLTAAAVVTWAAVVASMRKGRGE